MKFLVTVMRASQLISSTVSAVAVVIIVGYGIHQFVKEAKREQQVSRNRK